MAETILYKDSPAMFRNRPILFLFFCLLIPSGLGLIFLLCWWFQCWATSLVVTDQRVTLMQGILSKYTNDVLIADIRNVRVGQNIFQRLFGVGNVALSTSGQADMEIAVNGLPDPQRVKKIIDDCRAKVRKT